MSTSSHDQSTIIMFAFGAQPIVSQGVTHGRLAQEFQGADVRFGDVSDVDSLATTAFAEPVDVVVSCLASRTGGKVSAGLPASAKECFWKMILELISL